MFFTKVNFPKIHGSIAAINMNAGMQGCHFGWMT